MPTTFSRIHIFDVEHGECNIVETPTGQTIMIGAGHNSTTGWRPSDWIAKYGLHLTSVVLTNLDRDHLSDLPSFEPSKRPYYITRNFDVNPDWVARLKLEESGRIDPGVGTALHWMKNVYTGPRIDFDYGIEVRHFYHPPTKFQDTNNLSVVTFVSYAGVGVLFPGDVEKAGWDEFLKDAAFRGYLARTKVFIASHHGRINGYCADVFKYCSPDIIIISDKSVEHDTQDHNSYQNQASGLRFGNNLRKVLTTRSDGKITVDINLGGQYTVAINSQY